MGVPLTLAIAALGLVRAGSSPASTALCPAAAAPTTTTTSTTAATVVAPTTTTLPTTTTAPSSTSSTVAPATTTTAPPATTTTVAPTTTTAQPTTTTTTVPPPTPFTRLAGPDRYATAAAVSQADFAPMVDTVFLATGENFADALAAGPVAAHLRSPVLLVTRDALPPATATELDRLRPRQIIVLGGPLVVSDAVLARLDVYASGPVTRVAGPDRYATAAALSASAFQPGVPIALVTTGESFPDALAGGPVAGCAGGPLLLVTATSVPPATAAELRRLHPGRVVVVGAPSVVSAKLDATIAQLTGGTVDRASGVDRYDTAAAVSALAFPPRVSTVYVATGERFPDALAAGAVGGRDAAPILLVPSTGVPDATRAELRRLQPVRLVVLGGTGVVPDAVVTTLRSP